MTRDRINSISDLAQWIKLDAKARGRQVSVANFVKDPISRFMMWLRLNEFLANRKTSIAFRVLPMLLFRRISIRLGFSIPLNVFGPGLAIVHYGTIVVHPECRIGKNCRIHVGVSIGSGGTSPDGQTELTPTIGDNCYIGPGAKLFGRITIGDNCAIGANAVVNKSFEGESLSIAGVPARIVSMKGSMSKIAPAARSAPSSRA